MGNKSKAATRRADSIAAGKCGTCHKRKLANGKKECKKCLKFYADWAKKQRKAAKAAKKASKLAKRAQRAAKKLAAN